MNRRVTETLSKVKDSLGSNERHALPGVIGDESFAVWETATLSVHLHHCHGSYGGDHRPPYTFIDCATRADGTGTRCAGY